MRPPDPRPADLTAYTRLFDRWSATRHRETVQAHQLGYLEPRQPLRRRHGLPLLALLQLIIEPGGSIDFADRRTGFHGLAHRSSPRRVLRLWTDRLVSINHGLDWIFVIDASRPFDRTWLDVLLPPGAAPSEPRYAAVSASFAGPAPAGAFRVSDLDATAHTTLVRVEDHRTDADDCARAVRRDPTEHVESRALDHHRHAWGGDGPPHAGSGC